MKDEPIVVTWEFYDMFQAFLEAPSYHLLVEAALILWIVRLLFFTKSYKPDGNVVLTEKEKEQLVAEWQPEPLVPDIDEEENLSLRHVQNRIVNSKVGKYVIINSKKCLNLASMNFLGMTGRKEIEEEAVSTLRKYGVGTCGPRGFYGTMDVHIAIEEKIAKFMGCEEAIVYSYGFATIASAIPAYSKRGDIIFCDEGVCFAIQKGILASRSKVKFFKHNDMEDLERLLREQQEEDRKNPKKAKVTRRFLIAEGLYINHGDICPLPKLVELKWKYKVRIFLEESMSFGVLGKNGKGVTEHFNIPIEEIDLISASLENAMASAGGFCCGSSYVVDHQRLSGQGYCFSASQPALTATAAMKALEIMQQTPDLLGRLQRNSKLMHQQLTRLNGICVIGKDIAPIKHLQLAAPYGDRKQDLSILETIVEQVENQGVALTLASYLDTEETFLPPPSIRVSVNSELSEDDIVSAVDKLMTICETLL